MLRMTHLCLNQMKIIQKPKSAQWYLGPETWPVRKPNEPAHVRLNGSFSRTDQIRNLPGCMNDQLYSFIESTTKKLNVHHAEVMARRALLREKSQWSKK